MRQYLSRGLLIVSVALVSVACSGSTATTATATTATATTATATATATTATATATTATAGSSNPAATATVTPAVGGGDTCKFLSASDAATLLANPGPVKVVVADSPASKLTTCTWGKITTAGVLLMAQELKATTPVSVIKAAMLKDIVETIPGLGDGGGFETKTADAVTVTFIKGSTLILLTVSTTGVNADAVVAAAKTIAAGL
jgi:hypothetical protein